MPASYHALEVALHELAALLEAYYYDEVEEKRFVADADACDLCQDAEDLGWIGDDEVYEGVFGDEDGPPLHPHCGCGLEYRTRRYRVYESAPSAQMV